MSSAERAGTALSTWFKSLLRRLLPGPPAGSPREPVPRPERLEDPAPIPDFGTLAAAQFVHDLRNQLTIIIGCVDVLRLRTSIDDAEQEIDEIERCTGRAAQLTREILLAARPRTPARGLLDLNDVIALIVPRVTRLAGQKIRLRLRTSVVPVRIVAEFVELERLLLNLALNARDAMAGGGTLRIETARIPDLPAAGAQGLMPGPYARLTVSDTGCGMTPEIKARLFEPFFSTKETGTGLGLSSVAFTVRQLQGTIAVESQPNRGTSVTVHLPCAE